MSTTQTALPGLNCGLCGFRRCEELAARLEQEPELLGRCIPLQGGCSTAMTAESSPPASGVSDGMHLPVYDRPTWQDSLGREFSFYLEHFPEEPGPREVILPHNPLVTRELDVRAGDLLFGRPLGMSCGCPITHCGVAMDVDRRTGVISWCLTGPLRVREEGGKDLGYYIAEAYEGLVQRAQCGLRIGERYFFQPRMCMLQWRHSGLVNFMNRTKDGLQVRLEGLWIG